SANVAGQPPRDERCEQQSRNEETQDEPVATAARSRGGIFNGGHGRSVLVLGSAHKSNLKRRPSEWRSRVSQRTFADACATNDVGMWSVPLAQQMPHVRRRNSFPTRARESRTARRNEAAPSGVSITRSVRFEPRPDDDPMGSVDRSS